MNHNAHAYRLRPLRQTIENAVVGRIMNSRELESAINAILEDDRLWDDHYGKYEDEWIRFEEEFRAENPDEEWPDWTEEYPQKVQAHSFSFQFQESENSHYQYYNPSTTSDKFKIRFPFLFAYRIA